MSSENERVNPDAFWDASLSEAEEKLIREEAWYYGHHKSELQSYLRLMKRLKNKRSERVLQFLTNREIKQLRRRFSFLSLLTMVATITCIYLFIPVKWPQTGARFEVKDPEIALRETRKALMMLGLELKEGKEELQHLGKMDELIKEVQQKKE